MAVDLVRPNDVPVGVDYWVKNVLEITPDFVRQFDFCCVSSPCEEFALFGMRHFHPNPPYPATGIRLFNHAREACELAGTRYVMENVKAAQKWVGNSEHNCGSFYLWGNAVPPLMPQGISKTKMIRRVSSNFYFLCLQRDIAMSRMNTGENSLSENRG